MRSISPGERCCENLLCRPAAHSTGNSPPCRAPSAHPSPGPHASPRSTSLSPRTVHPSSSAPAQMMSPTPSPTSAPSAPRNPCVSEALSPPHSVAGLPLQPACGREEARVRRVGCGSGVQGRWAQGYQGRGRGPTGGAQGPEVWTEQVGRGVLEWRAGSQHSTGQAVRWAAKRWAWGTGGM